MRLGECRYRIKLGGLGYLSSIRSVFALTNDYFGDILGAMVLYILHPDFELDIISSSFRPLLFHMSQYGIRSLLFYSIHQCQCSKSTIYIPPNFSL